jgi:hypothetical protein
VKYGSFISFPSSSSSSSSSSIPRTFSTTPFSNGRLISFQSNQSTFSSASSSSLSSLSNQANNINPSGTFLTEIDSQYLRSLSSEIEVQYQQLVNTTNDPSNEKLLEKLLSPYDILPEELDDGEDGGADLKIKRDPLLECWKNSLILRDSSLLSMKELHSLCSYDEKKYSYSFSLAANVGEKGKEEEAEKERMNHDINAALRWWGIRSEPLLLTEVIQRFPKAEPPKLEIPKMNLPVDLDANKKRKRSRSRSLSGENRKKSNRFDSNEADR